MILLSNISKIVTFKEKRVHEQITLVMEIALTQSLFLMNFNKFVIKNISKNFINSKLDN